MLWKGCDSHVLKYWNKNFYVKQGGRAECRNSRYSLLVWFLYLYDRLVHSFQHCWTLFFFLLRKCPCGDHYFPCIRRLILLKIIHSTFLSFNNSARAFLFKKLHFSIFAKSATTIPTDIHRFSFVLLNLAEIDVIETTNSFSLAVETRTSSLPFAFHYESPDRLHTVPFPWFVFCTCGLSPPAPSPRQPSLFSNLPYAPPTFHKKSSRSSICPSHPFLPTRKKKDKTWGILMLPSAVDFRTRWIYAGGRFFAGTWKDWKVRSL